MSALSSRRVLACVRSVQSVGLSSRSVFAVQHYLGVHEKGPTLGRLFFRSASLDALQHVKACHGRLLAPWQGRLASTPSGSRPPLAPRVDWGPPAAVRGGLAQVFTSPRLGPTLGRPFLGVRLLTHSVRLRPATDACWLRGRAVSFPSRLDHGPLSPHGSIEARRLRWEGACLVAAAPHERGALHSTLLLEVRPVKAAPCAVQTGPVSGDGQLVLWHASVLPSIAGPGRRTASCACVYAADTAETRGQKPIAAAVCLSAVVRRASSTCWVARSAGCSHIVVYEPAHDGK